MRTILSLFLVVFLFLGCSNKPNENTVKDFLVEKVTNESGGNLNLENFTKTNGMEKEIFGQKVYELEFNFSLVAVNTFWKKENGLTGRLEAWNKFDVLTSKPSNMGGWAIAFGGGVTAQQYNKGANVSFTNCKAFLEKTENGWRVKNIKLGEGQVSNNQEVSSSSSNKGESESSQAQEAKVEGVIRNVEMQGNTYMAAELHNNNTVINLWLDGESHFDWSKVKDGAELTFKGKWSDMEGKKIFIPLTMEENNKNANPSKQTQNKEDEKNDWLFFWPDFTTAIKNKNKESLLNLSSPTGENFYDPEGGQGSAKNYVNTMMNEGTWSALQASVNSGYKRTKEYGEVRTKDNALIFVFKNGKWYFAGYMGD